ncbi:MAG: 2-deoxy-D-gluconate 3-dehydrogenase, partial [Desulfobacteraceae bacterium]|nr:2-deoxy-D-gluconate 3-dehydrogenase [Desulfobacteraceae bacterium]
MDCSFLSLQGKVGLITGASRGIGKAIAVAFADAGADVV